jgi:putative endonuclease
VIGRRLEPRGMAAFVYILRCNDGSYYVGCTTNIEQRMALLYAGTFVGYTSTRRPVTLVGTAESQSIRDAIDFERRLKRWSRTKKEAVIRGAWDELPGLAARGFRPASI